MSVGDEAEQFLKRTDADAQKPVRLAVNLPAWMFNDLHARAKAAGMTATVLVRRAVSFERLVFDDPDNEVTVTNRRTGESRTFTVLR